MKEERPISELSTSSSVSTLTSLFLLGHTVAKQRKTSVSDQTHSDNTSQFNLVLDSFLPFRAY